MSFVSGHFILVYCLRLWPGVVALLRWSDTLGQFRIRFLVASHPHCGLTVRFDSGGIALGEGGGHLDGVVERFYGRPAWFLAKEWHAVNPFGRNDARLNKEP